MCVERIHRVIMAIVIAIAGYLMSVSCAIGLFLQGFVVVMLLIWAVTDFCPMVMVLSKFMPRCNEKCNK